MEENWQDICETRKLLKECLPDRVGISVSYPLPGTSFFNQVKSQIKEKTHWVDSGDFEMLYEGTYSPLFYRRLHRFINIEYRLTKILADGNFKLFPRMAYIYFKFTVYFTFLMGCRGIHFMKTRLKFFRRIPVVKETS